MTKPILYRYLVSRMIVHADVSKVHLSYHRAREIIAWYKIPIEIRNKIINELIDYGMLERINKKSLLIKEPASDFLKPSRL